MDVLTEIVLGPGLVLVGLLTGRDPASSEEGWTLAVTFALFFWLLVLTVAWMMWRRYPERFTAPLATRSEQLSQTLRAQGPRARAALAEFSWALVWRIIWRAQVVHLALYALLPAVWAVAISIAGAPPTEAIDGRPTQTPPLANWRQPTCWTFATMCWTKRDDTALDAATPPQQTATVATLSARSPQQNADIGWKAVWTVLTAAWLAWRLMRRPKSASAPIAQA